MSKREIAARRASVRNAKQLVASLPRNPDAEFLVAAETGVSEGGKAGLGIAVGMSRNGLAALARWILRELPPELKASIREELQEGV